MNTLVLFTTYSNPTVPTNLQDTLDNSIINNTNALTTEFKLKNYTGINQTRLLGYYIFYLIIGKYYRPIWQYRYNIKYSKIGKWYQVYKLYYKKRGLYTIPIFRYQYRKLFQAYAE